MGLLDFIRGNTIDRLKMPELQEEEMRLKNQIERARKDINKVEKDKTKNFKEGVGADLIKKKMLAQEIKHLDMQAQLKYKTFMTLHKQYMFISNLVIIKKYEKNLRQTKIWTKITSIYPEKFENALIKINLKGKTYEEILDNLNRVFEMGIPESEVTEDEAEKQLFDAWNSVEAGSLDVDDATKMISIEKDIEAKEAEEK